MENTIVRYIFYSGVYRGHIGIMEKIETTVMLFRV